ncbi:VTT domain-containing protein [Candidatus Bathyarchaeota archaeon]|nr:VTT domain-containing protein [Candidatus Bathyarchaeota archaeon]
MGLWGWMEGLVRVYGYLGAFLISIFGNFTILFPVPYTLTIYAFGATLNPLLLGLVCGVGSTIGEFSAYLLGLGGRKLLGEGYKRRLESARRLVERYGMLAIFLFAYLPLPDDLILIPLGMLRYDLRKALIAAFLGKTAMGITIAYAGRFSYVFIRDLFGGGGGPWGAIATAILLVVIMVALIRIDWAELLERMEAKRSSPRSPS